MKSLLSIAVLWCSLSLPAQTISGRLQALPNQQISLHAFDGFETYEVDAVQISATGAFMLSYKNTDYGIGYLKVAGQKPHFMILSDENTTINGMSDDLADGMEIKEGEQNRLFATYVTQQPQREQALLAWDYLEDLYQAPQFEGFSKDQFSIEKMRLQQEEAAFLEQLPEGSYVQWFLPLRKLVSSVSTVAKYRPEEISSTIASFRALDYTDNRLYKSGLLKDAIEGHFWLIENSGLPLDSVFAEMHISIDAMVEQLVADEAKLNAITDYLFDLLERHSLFTASEHLALKVLNETSCTINSDLAKQLETYRAMKPGNEAKNISLKAPYLKYGLYTSKECKSIKDFNAPYTLVVFGASWCPKCNEDLPKLAAKYANWKASGVEVLLVSLDENEAELEAFIKPFPFTTICDFKKWESPVVADYHVFGTPTMFLLNKDLEIELRPSSIEHMDAWVDWFLNKKDKS